MLSFISIKFLPRILITNCFYQPANLPTRVKVVRLGSCLSPTLNCTNALDIYIAGWNNWSSKNCMGLYTPSYKYCSLLIGYFSWQFFCPLLNNITSQLCLDLWLHCFSSSLWLVSNVLINWRQFISVQLLYIVIFNFVFENILLLKRFYDIIESVVDSFS